MNVHRVILLLKALKLISNYLLLIIKFFFILNYLFYIYFKNVFVLWNFNFFVVKYTMYSRNEIVVDIVIGGKNINYIKRNNFNQEKYPWFFNQQMKVLSKKIAFLGETR